MADYPSHLARQRTLVDGRTVVIRPIRAEDEPAEREFFTHLSGDTKRMRFMKYVGAVTDQLIHFYSHIDYDQHMAFVCEAQVDGQQQLVGEARYMANPHHRSCEFGVVIADDWHKTGIAGLLMEALIRYAHAHGFETMEGLVLRENRDMIKFVRALGFDVAAAVEDPTTVRAVRKL